VIPIYVAASDESDADIAAHVATYDAIIAGIRTWYTDHLPGEDPIAFHAEPVRALRGHYTKDQWDWFGTHGFEYPDGTTTAPDGGCSMYYGTLYELTDRGLLADAGLPPPGTANVLYYAIAGGGTNGSCAPAARAATWVPRSCSSCSWPRRAARPAAWSTGRPTARRQAPSRTSSATASVSLMASTGRPAPMDRR
jgi:hypothetical protein